MLFSLGTRLDASIEAADRLAGNGMIATIADARFAKPLDTMLIDDLARTHELLLIVEEVVRVGFPPITDIPKQIMYPMGCLKCAPDPARYFY